MLQRRWLHRLNALPFKREVGSFLSAPAVALLVEAQKMHLEAVNRLTLGSEWSSRTLLQIVQSTHRLPQRALLHHHASQAWNGDHFLQGLSPEPVRMNDQLLALLERDFGTLTQFQEQA